MFAFILQVIREEIHVGHTHTPVDHMKQTTSQEELQSENRISTYILL